MVHFYSGIKIEDLLQKISACGRAVWVVDETGKVKVIMDGPVDYTKGVISDENCLSSSNSFSYEEAPAGLFCTFNDENDGFENNSFYVWSDGNSMERHHGSVDSFHIDFVTNPYQMHSLGRYFLACLIQSKESLTRKIGPGGIIYSIGDVLLVQSRELLIGETSGRIQDVIVYDGFIYGFVTDVTYEYTAELDTDGNSVQGVTIVQPRYAGKSNAVTLPLSEPRTIDITSGYIEVTPKGNENPQQEGWYEKDGNNYVLTTDTTVVAGHTYYEAIVNSYTLEKGTTNVVLFGKISDIYHDEVVFTPMSKAVDWVTNTNAGRGLFIGLGSGSLLVAMVGAFFGPAGIAIGALLGLVVGGFVGWAIGYNIDEKQSAGGKINNKNNYADKEGQHPDVRGCANQTIVGNNFPCVIGKHLTTPFIVGDPYTEYSGTKGKDAYIRELLCVGEMLLQMLRMSQKMIRKQKSYRLLKINLQNFLNKREETLCIMKTISDIKQHLE